MTHEKKKSKSSSGIELFVCTDPRFLDIASWPFLAGLTVLTFLHHPCPEAEQVNFENLVSVIFKLQLQNRPGITQNLPAFVVICTTILKFQLSCQELQNFARVPA